MIHRPGNFFSQARLAGINLYTTRRLVMILKALRSMSWRRVRQVRRVYLEFLPPPGAHTFFAARLQVCA